MADGRYTDLITWTQIRQPSMLLQIVMINLLLHKTQKESETHRPPVLKAKEGIPIRMLDIRSWNFKYRYWTNNNSRMHVLEYTGEFVHEHGLGADDPILIYRNVEDGEYVIEGRKKVEDDARSLCVDNYSGMCELSNELTIPELPVFWSSSDYQYVYEST